jgi:hypothetical protein
MFTKAERIWMEYGRRLNWSLNKCELLVDLYSPEEEYQDVCEPEFQDQEGAQRGDSRR